MYENSQFFPFQKIKLPEGLESLLNRNILIWVDATSTLFFADVELSLQQGVYLYLGYSAKDEALLKKVTNQGALEAIGAIQGLVSYHNVNSNKVRLT